MILVLLDLSTVLGRITVDRDRYSANFEPKGPSHDGVASLVIGSRSSVVACREIIHQLVNGAGCPSPAAKILGSLVLRCRTRNLSASLFGRIRLATAPPRRIGRELWKVRKSNVAASRYISVPTPSRQARVAEELEPSTP